MDRLFARVSSMRLNLEDLTLSAAVGAAKNGRQMGLVAEEMSKAGGRLEEAVEALAQNQEGVTKVAEAASSAAALAGAITDTTGRGGQVISEAIDSIVQTQAEITRVREMMATLTARSAEITRVVGLIASIAARTNLLALNAAIEAARAGEHGRGFAVVAGEVRKLAESAARQTAEVRELVESIAGDLSTVDGVIAESKQLADRGAALAGEANAALGQIRELTQRSVGPLEEIAAMAEEQSAALEQVSGSFQEMTGRIAAATSQAQVVASVSTGLAEMTEKAFVSLSAFQSGSFVDTTAEVARAVAAEVQAILGAKVEQGAVTLTDLLALDYFEYKGERIDRLRHLFDTSKVPRTGFTPPKYGTAYDTLVDLELRDLLDRVLQENPAFRFLSINDLNGYACAQNSEYSRAWTGDPKLDSNNRVKRFNCDEPWIRAARVGFSFAEKEPLTTGPEIRNLKTVHSRREFLAAGLDLTERRGSSRQVLVQTFTRPTGTIVNILSVPLFMDGQRYGAVMVGWLPEGNVFRR